MIVRSIGLTAAIAFFVAVSGCRSHSRAADGSIAAFRDGNAALALKLVRQAENECGSRAECRWSTRLLEAEILLSDDQISAAAAILAEEPPKSAAFASLAARRMWLLGDLEFARGHRQNSETLLSQAAMMASAAGAGDVELEIAFSQARLTFLLHHDLAKADGILRNMASAAAKRRDAYHEAVALNGIGMLRLKDWRFDEAIPWFQKTAEAAGQGGGQRLIVAAGHNLAICYSQLGRFEQAIQSRQRAIDLLGKGGLAPYRMKMALEMGNTYYEEGDDRRAMEYYGQALQWAASGADKAKIYRMRAAAGIHARDWDAAEQNNNTSLTYANDEEARLWAGKNAAAIAAGRGRSGEAIELYQKTIQEARSTPIVLWESYAGLAREHSIAKDYVHGNAEFEEAINVIDANADQISVADYRLTFFSRLVELYQNYVRSLVAQKQFDRALEMADSSRARILLQRLSSRRTVRKASAAEYTAMAKASGSVLLFYWIAPEESYLWVVTPQRVYPPFVLPAAEQIRQWVDQYRAFIEQRVGDPIAQHSDAGQHLYDALIAPAAKLIPPNAKVILFPDGPLNWLSFETLPVYADKPHYWIEDARPVIGPSLAVLVAEKTEKSPRADSLLMIGDPAPPDPEFPKLAFASQEIATIEARFPGAEKTALMGAAARPAAYRDAKPGDYSLLHFSTHAVANRESPLDSAIILSGDRDNYKLYARSIIDTPLKAGLVTISACRSAGAQSYLGEGLVGFAWAFLQAGAHNVIAGLWDVTDSSTPAMMNVLYSGVAAGKEPADALRAAKLDLIHSNQGYRKPYYWGPFEIYTRDAR